MTRLHKEWGPEEKGGGAEKRDKGGGEKRERWGGRVLAGDMHGKRYRKKERCDVSSNQIVPTGISTYSSNFMVKATTEI